MKIDDLQTVFMLFYAIFWGSVANVQPRWKAFQWPLFFKLPQVRCRAMAALFFLNVLPLCFFAYGMWALHGRGPTKYAPLGGSLHYVIRGVVPAFAVFGLYRFWLAVVELHPDCFYASDRCKLDKKYWYVEPTYRLGAIGPEKTPGDTPIVDRDTPIVDLVSDAGWMNLGFGSLYVLIGTLAPFCPLP
jgi:hypothetical protein